MRASPSAPKELLKDRISALPDLNRDPFVRELEERLLNPYRELERSLEAFRNLAREYVADKTMDPRDPGLATKAEALRQFRNTLGGKLDGYIAEAGEAESELSSRLRTQTLTDLGEELNADLIAAIEAQLRPVRPEAFNALRDAVLNTFTNTLIRVGLEMGSERPSQGLDEVTTALNGVCMESIVQAHTVTLNEAKKLVTEQEREARLFDAREAVTDKLGTLLHEARETLRMEPRLENAFINKVAELFMGMGSTLIPAQFTDIATAYDREHDRALLSESEDQELRRLVNMVGISIRHGNAPATEKVVLGQTEVQIALRKTALQEAYLVRLLGLVDRMSVGLDGKKKRQVLDEIRTKGAAVIGRDLSFDRVRMSSSADRHELPDAFDLTDPAKRSAEVRWESDPSEVATLVVDGILAALQREPTLINSSAPAAPMGAMVLDEAGIAQVVTGVTNKLAEVLPAAQAQKPGIVRRTLRAGAWAASLTAVAVAGDYFDAGHKLAGLFTADEDAEVVPPPEESQPEKEQEPGSLPTGWFKLPEGLYPQKGDDATMWTPGLGELAGTDVNGHAMLMRCVDGNPQGDEKYPAYAVSLTTGPDVNWQERGKDLKGYEAFPGGLSLPEVCVQAGDGDYGVVLTPAPAELQQ
jgi:hypothetical protein